MQSLATTNWVSHWIQIASLRHVKCFCFWPQQTVAAPVINLWETSKLSLRFATSPFDTYLLTHTFICQIVDTLHFFIKWSLPFATYHLTQIWICQLVECLHFWYNNQYYYGIYLGNKGVTRKLNDLGWVAWIDLCYLRRGVKRKMTWGDLLVEQESGNALIRINNLYTNIEYQTSMIIM